MPTSHASNDKLIREFQELQQKFDSLEVMYNTLVTERAKAEDTLVNANKEFTFQNAEKEKRAAELLIANKELAFQNQEKEKRAAELIIANKELAFQNEEKEKRAAELLVANKELTKVKEELANLNAHLEVAIVERTAELMLANKELEQFAYIASHDLQEPLRMVSSYTQLLERRYKDKLDNDAIDFIHFAVDGANRMQTLINDLLDYSCISTKTPQLYEVNMTEILGFALANLQQNIQENKAVVTYDELPVLAVDESQMIRVFQNLIGNAIKYKKKTEPPQIHISCTKKKDLYEFAVSDNGIGIDKQFHEKIFIIFQRLHTKEEYSGTGIGLAVCKRIVERHGGKIWFDTNEYGGTTFYFTLKSVQQNKL